ncbi:hypothetical protein LWI28_023034 [Acer negundo]|uniref:Reverse transcriptase domain-containing protein n=1 Tax=Acer negundo TaxID=4023 RepID=A0AAD5JU43_ACENE|nr:hypothetical protein LWI28_023034 [Acer negundo]
MDPMCMEAALSLSSPVAVSSTSTTQFGMSMVSGVNSSSRVVPLASGGVCSLVGELIPPQHEGDVSAHLELCRNALIGHVVLSSGERPWKLVDLKARLSKHWMLNSDWRLISLGRGYYQILLKSPAEMNHVWGFDLVHLNPGILCLQPRVPDFKPSLQKSTNAQLDKATSDGDFGHFTHFARVLVDVDVSSMLPTLVLLERDEFHNSFIDVEYDNLPAFCSTCSSICHLSSSCRWNKSSKVPLSSTTKSTQDIAGDSRVFGDDGFQPDVDGHDSVVVHTSVGSNLISSSTSFVGLVLSSNPSSSTISTISEVASSSVPPMISQVLQISKDSGFDDGVTDSVLVSNSSVVDPSISYVSSDVIFSSESYGYRQVRVHEILGNQSSEECFYRDRSRVRWLRDGDQNTSFFHASIKHDVIPSLVTAVENVFLTSVPSADDIHDAVFAMDAASALGPDGFSSSLNSSFIVLLPKLRDSISVDQFRPIVLSNFLFKISSKILADRLARVAARIISPRQFSFIRDRHIEDCIALASDCVNVLQKKCYGGNLAMKIDIRKAFDTLDWFFLCRVLQAFGFSFIFVDWIDGILCSSRLSILFNGIPERYFCCSRGVRQGDPLSPLLFGITEDFLSRLLTRLVGSSQILPISSPRGFLVPTHLLYADDVLIFCRGTQKNLKHIMGAFRDYGNISGQLVNWGKSSIYFGSSISPSQIGSLQSLIGMQIGQLPFSYLGVPLFRGKPRKAVLRHIANKILSKFAKWKGKFLSLASHATLIRSVITGSFVHSFMIYKWPSSFLSLINRKLRNFLWTGSCFLLRIVFASPGFQLASHCSICRVSSESADHIFIHCPLAVTLWEVVFSAFQRHFSTETWQSFFLQAMSVSFSEQGHPSKAPVIKSVIWSPPAPGWIKVNTDNAVMGSLGFGGCGGIFRNCRAFVNGCFAIPLGQVFTFEVELLAASLAINFTWKWFLGGFVKRGNAASSRSPDGFSGFPYFHGGESGCRWIFKHALELQGDSWWFSAPPFYSTLVDNDYMGRESFRFS